MGLEVLHDGEPKWEPAEECCLCSAKTRFWYLPNDVALCEACATTHEDSHIPTKREWLQKVNGAHIENENWKCQAERRAEEVCLPDSMISVVDGIAYVAADTAGFLLQTVRSQHEAIQQARQQEIDTLDYIVEVQDARAEGRTIPEGPSVNVVPCVPASLPQDRLVEVIAKDKRARPVVMIELAHLQRFLAAEEARSKRLTCPLKRKLNELKDSIRCYIQAGELM